MKNLDGKTALITGAGQGIGEAIAIRFAEENMNVIINCKGKEEAKKSGKIVKKKLEKIYKKNNSNRKCIVLIANVARKSQVFKMYDDAIRKFKTIDVLVNNAGFQTTCESHKVTVKDFRDVLKVNLRGAFICSTLAITHFLDKKIKGCIINISSVHEKIPKPNYLAYSISKGGMGNMTRTLALEYARKKIRVNSVAPGAILTPMNQSLIENYNKRKSVEDHVPLHFIGKPEDISSCVTFLASDEASYITGQTIYVDGGFTLYPEFSTSWSSGT